MMIVMLTVMCDDNDHRLSEHQQPSKIFKENLFNYDLSQSIDCRQKRPESIKSITSNASLCILVNIVCDNSVNASKGTLLKSKGSRPLISESDLEEGQRTKERLLCLRCWEGFQIRFLILDILIAANINTSEKYLSQSSFQTNEICIYMISLMH